MNEQLARLLGVIENLPTQRAAVAFEDLVLALLGARASDQGVELEKAIRTSPNHPVRAFDALYAGDLDGVPGPVGIEVHYFRRHEPKSFATRLNDFAGQASMHAAQSQLRGAVLLSNEELPAKTRDYVQRFLSQLPASPRIVVWGLRELEILANRFPGVVLAFLEDAPLKDPSLVSVKTEILAGSEEWRGEAERLLSNLRSDYRAGDITLFLGAGVSVAAGVPDWGRLLEGLFVTLAAREFKHPGENGDLLQLARLAKRLGGDAPLLVARYIRTGLSSSESSGSAFMQRVTNLLYEGVGSERGKLLEEIGHLCQPGRTGPTVRSVITYNFDDLLEEELSSKRIEFNSVYLPVQKASRLELPIYHAHGFLPRNPDLYPDVGESLLAFSEEGYHVVYREPYHWSNIVQLNALRETVCVFVGLSLSDPNLRRLLETAAANDRPPHYAFLKRISPAEAMSAAGRDPQLDVSARGVDAVLDTHHVLQERMLGELGLRVIWYEEHRDLPDMLASLV